MMRPYGRRRPAVSAPPGGPACPAGSSPFSPSCSPSSSPRALLRPAARDPSPLARPALLPAPCPATSEEENAALVRRYLEEAYNGRNPAMADEHLADYFVRHSVASPHLDQAHGNDDDATRVEQWLTAFPDLHVAIEKLITSEDMVVGLLIWSGTHDGPLPHWDAPVTGQAMSGSPSPSIAWSAARSQRTGSSRTT